VPVVREFQHRYRWGFGEPGPSDITALFTNGDPNLSLTGEAKANLSPIDTSNVSLSFVDGSGNQLDPSRIVILQAEHLSEKSVITFQFRDDEDSLARGDREIDRE
jgi:hypothetical protein